MGDKLLKLLKFSDVATAIGIIGVVFMLIVPLPSAILDVFLALNIAMAIVIILKTSRFLVVILKHAIAD